LTDVSLVAMAVIWGVNFSVVKYGTTLIHPLAYNGARLILASLVLGAAIALGRQPMPPRRAILGLMGLGVIGNGVYQFFFVEGVALTSATDAALVVASSPALVAVISQMRGVERVSVRGITGILLSMGGIALVVSATAANGHGTSSLGGDLLVLAGSLAWAIYTVMLKPYTERISGMQISAFTMFGGTLALLIVATPAMANAPWRTVPLLGWGALFYSGVFALVIAYYFFYHGVRVIGPTRTSVYSNLQPVAAVLMAWLLLGETPTPSQVLGAVAIVTGLLLTRT
jgi:drug/metabolite transporter (DMT)-like permease